MTHPSSPDANEQPERDVWQVREKEITNRYIDEFTSLLAPFVPSEQLMSVVAKAMIIGGRFGKERDAVWTAIAALPPETREQQPPT